VVNNPVTGLARQHDWRMAASAPSHITIVAGIVLPIAGPDPLARQMGARRILAGRNQARGVVRHRSP